MKKPEIMIVAGPSAVGKTTVATEIIGIDSRFEFVRSVTTRAKRGDAFDDEYIYLSKEEFLECRRTGGVLESTEYAGAFYGTPRSEVERISGENKIPLLVLDTRGVMSLMAHEDISTCAVYVYDDVNVMEKRLYDRFLGASPSVEGLRKFTSRKDKNIEDYREIRNTAPYFYTFVENSGTVRETAEKLISVFSEFCAGVSRNDSAVSSVAEKLAQSVENKT